MGRRPGLAAGSAPTTPAGSQTCARTTGWPGGGRQWRCSATTRSAGTGALTSRSPASACRDDGTPVREPHSVPLQLLADTRRWSVSRSGRVRRCGRPWASGARCDAWTGEREAAAALACLPRGLRGPRARRLRPRLPRRDRSGAGRLRDAARRGRPAACAPGASLAHRRPRRSSLRCAVLVVLVTPLAGPARGRPLDPRARRRAPHRCCGRRAPRPVAEPALARAAVRARRRSRPRGRQAAARALYEQATELQPENPETWSRSALFELVARGDMCARLPRLERRLHARPEQSPVGARAARSTARATRSTTGRASRRLERGAQAPRMTTACAPCSWPGACRRAAPTSRMPRSRARRLPSPSKPGGT